MSNSSNALSSIFAITRAASIRTFSSSSSIRSTLSTQCASTTHQHRHNLPPQLISSQTPTHSFSTTPHPFKKQGSKGASKNTIAINAAKTEKPGVSEDPCDFSALEAEIERVVKNLREEISRIKPGGIDVEAVENARVQLKGSTGNAGGGAKGRGGGRDKLGAAGGGGGGGGGKEVVKVGDLCQVFVKLRKLVLLVGEKEYLKPLTTTLCAPPLNLTPTSPTSLSPSTSPTSTTNPPQHQSLELHIPIPPTTTESRLAALALVSARGAHAERAVREARGVEKKRIRSLELARKVGPDLARRAEKELEVWNGRGVGRVREVVEGGRRGLGAAAKEEGGR